MSAIRPATWELSSDDGVVVFGTGWWYPGMWCGDFWCGWPWTWGFGFQFSYWGGGWFWRPVGHYWWYHTTPVVHRAFYEHWNPHWGTPNRTWVRGNVNAYSHWEGNAVVARTFESRGAVSPQGVGARPDAVRGPGRSGLPASFGWLVSAEQRRAVAENACAILAWSNNASRVPSAKRARENFRAAASHPVYLEPSLPRICRCRRTLAADIDSFKLPGCAASLNI